MTPGYVSSIFFRVSSIFYVKLQSGKCDNPLRVSFEMLGPVEGPVRQRFKDILAVNTTCGLKKPLVILSPAGGGWRGAPPTTMTAMTTKTMITTSTTPKKQKSTAKTTQNDPKTIRNSAKTTQKRSENDSKI